MILASVFAGLLPESLFFALWITFAKKLPLNKCLKLFGLFSAIKLASSALLAFNIWFYPVTIALMFAAMLWICKSHLIDVFLIISANTVLIILGLAYYFSISNFIVALIVNRISLFLALILLKTFLHKLYSLYRISWNRTPDNKIKAVTTRNISIIVLNISFVLLNTGVTIALNAYQNNVLGVEQLCGVG